MGAKGFFIFNVVLASTSLYSANILLSNHAKSNNDQSATESKVTSDCDNLQGKLCSEANFKERVDKLEKIQSDLRDILQNSFEKTQGGQARDLVLKTLKAEGFNLKNNIPESVIQYSLIPPQFHKVSPEELGLTPPTEETVFSSLGLKYYTCEEEDGFFKISSSERAKLIESLKNEVAPLFKKVSVSSQLFSEVYSVKSSDEKNAWTQESKKLFNASGYVDELAYVYDRADYDESYREKLPKLYEAYLEKLFEASMRVIEITKQEFKNRKKEKIDIWTLQELHKAFYGQKDINSQLQWETSNRHITNGLKVIVSNESTIKENDKKIKILKEEILEALSKADPKKIAEVFKEHANIDQKDKKIIDTEINQLVSLRKSKAKSESFSPIFQNILTKLRNDENRNRWVYEKDFQNTFEEDKQSFEFFLYRTYCNKRNELISQHVNESIEKTFSKMSLSRPVVEAVTEYFYSDKNKALQNEIFNSTKTLELEVLKTKVLPHIKDAQKRSKVLKRFENASLGIPPDPNKLSWEKGVLPGVESLDLDALDMFEVYYSQFEDPKLRGLTQINAFYIPEVPELSSVSKKVFIFPGTVNLFSDRKEALTEILAHEIGHSVDPNSLRQSGIDVRDDYKTLMECLASKESVSARKDQMGECFADWMATEVLALKILKTPKENRLNLINEMISFHCFASRSADIFERANDDVHLSSIRRLNGILGAHPVIREALGCPVNGTYKYCEMNNAEKL